VLSWRIREGPKVKIGSIRFCGNFTLDPGLLKRQMLVKESTLFKSAPFVMKKLLLSIRKIKLYYQQQGWLDIDTKGRVFIEEIRFNPRKTIAHIKIHIDEPQRYTIEGLSIKGSTIFKEEELLAQIGLKKGSPYIQNLVHTALERIRRRYAELGYLEVSLEIKEEFFIDKPEVRLHVQIQEPQRIYMGRLIIKGNTRTKDEVIRRAFRIYPGQKLDMEKLLRGVARLRDTRWFEPEGFKLDLCDTADPSVKDVLLELKERKTGNIRFAGGYSANYGLIGIFELTQINFDIADLPESLAEIPFSFCGGGQYLRILLSPGVGRSAYSFDFREPYLFGKEAGLGVELFNIDIVRESYTEGRRGTRVILDKRWGDLKIGLESSFLGIKLWELEPDAPRSIKALQGRNEICSAIPFLQYDNRDSVILPTEGVNLGISFHYSGGFLPGDFNFVKTQIHAEHYFTLYRTGGGFKHVLALRTRFGCARPTRLDEDLPTFERFFAGGSGSLRGFRFRGVGPRENGDPIGGNALLLASVEYTFPIYHNYLRGALFVDSGSLVPKLRDLKGETLRVSVGFGVRIAPFGIVPIAIDIAFPVRKRHEDERQTVLIDFTFYY
jgi:outer membrane protein insertion porin family